VDPNEYIVPLSQRWRDEPRGAVADSIGRAIGALVTKNPGRIRSDTLVSVLRAKLPGLVERAKDIAVADAPKSAAMQPINVALEVVTALGEQAGVLVSVITAQIGKGSAVDLMLSGTIERLALSASGAGPAMKQLVIEPLPRRSVPRTVATYAEAQSVAIAAARALAATGAAGRADLDSLWNAHNAPSPQDTVVDLPKPVKKAPTDSAGKAAMLKRPPPGTPAGDSLVTADSIQAVKDSVQWVADREKAKLTKYWLSPSGRGMQLDHEIRRQALVAGLGVACQADGATAVALATLGESPTMTYLLPPPDGDDAVAAVKTRVADERVRTRVAAFQQLEQCGNKAQAALPVIRKITNSADGDPDVPEAVRAAASKALSKVRKVE
jgi:hypothetical protein